MNSQYTDKQMKEIIKTQLIKEYRAGLKKCDCHNHNNQTCETCDPKELPFDLIMTAPRGSGKTTIILEKIREERLKEMLRTKDDEEAQRRRVIINKCKVSLKKKFDDKVKLLHHKNVFDKSFTDKMFCAEMTILIEQFQKMLDKLKINGIFYTD